MTRACALMALVVSAAAAGDLRAQGNEDPEQIATWAMAAEAELEYTRALELWNTVIAHPRVSPELRTRASFHAGAIERIAGNSLQARYHFTYVLKQDIDYVVPAGTEPKISQHFEMIRAELRGESRATPAVDPDEADGDGPTPLTYFGVGSLGAAVIVGGLAATAGLFSNAAQAAAMETDIQTERNARYDERDLYSGVATGGWIAGGALLVVGASLLVLELVGS